MATPNSNSVTSVTVSWDSIVDRADGGLEEPYPVWEFGGGRKIFWSNRQGDGIYGKPVSIVDGVVTHLPDPDLIPT